MKLLVCPLCEGEIEIVGNFDSYKKKVKCLHCGFQNFNDKEKQKDPEIIYKRRG